MSLLGIFAKRDVVLLILSDFSEKHHYSNALRCVLLVVHDSECLEDQELCVGQECGGLLKYIARYRSGTKMYLIAPLSILNLVYDPYNSTFNPVHHLIL